MYTPRDYQELAIKKGVEVLTSSKNNRSLIVAPTGCHEKDYGILMFNGKIKKVQDVIVGDYVMGIDSSCREVLKTVSGFGKMYKIFLRNKEFFVVNEDHILNLYRTGINSIKNKCYPIEISVSVKDYLLWAKSRKHLYKIKKSGVTFNNKYDLNLDPYFLGLWLGDGSSDSACITTIDDEIKNYLYNFSLKENTDITIIEKSTTKAVGIRLKTKKKFTLNPLINKLKKLNVINNKHIPLKYKTSSESNIIKLLEGIIDSDGSYDKIKNRYEVPFKNKVLAYDLYYICNVLGLYPSINYKRTTCSNCKEDFNSWCYRVCFRGNEKIKPILERKKYVDFKHQGNGNMYSFTIDSVDDDNYYGFVLDKDNLFLDEKFIIQHNSGKSHIISDVLKGVDEPTIILQPSKELLKQNYEKFINIGGEANVYSASMKSNDLGKITFATIGSIKKEVDKVKALGIKCLIIDESHLLTQNNSAIIKFIKDTNIKNVLGLTATPIYLKGGIDGAELKMMNRVRGALFKDIAHVTQISELVEKGFWSKLLYIEDKTDESLLKLNTNGSDYTLESQKEYYKYNSLQEKVISYVDRLRRDNRKSILIFVPSIEEAIELQEILPRSKAVYSGMLDKDRDQIIEDFKTLKLNVVINVNILSVGFDHPQLDAIITARSTNSIALFYQQLGRGVRIFPTKKNCRIIDLSGNVSKFGKIEELNFEYITGYGWGMFTGDKLLSNYPMQAKRRPTKESLRRGVKRKALGLKDSKGKVKIWFGKFKGKNLEEVHKENENYLTWMIDNFDFNGIKMKNLKKEIELILNL